MKLAGLLAGLLVVSIAHHADADCGNVHFMGTPTGATIPLAPAVLANGNTLANYGSGGVIREITPDKQTAFHVKFDAPNGDDFYNKMVGHNELIDDLYALNGGGPR